MYTNIIHNDDICNYFLKNQQFIFNSLGNCRECRMLTALSSVVQFVLEVIILFGLVGILVAMNVEFAVGEWKRLKMSARLRLLRASSSARFLYRPSATIPCPQMPLMKTQRSISGV